jgi:hypothetical protein
MHPWRDRSRASADVKRIALEHVAALEAKRREIEEMANTFRYLAENCHGDGRPDCPIIESLAEGCAHHASPRHLGRLPSKRFHLICLKPSTTRVNAMILRPLAILAALLALPVLHSSDVARADATQCYSIQNRDKQNYCLATAKSEPTYCYSIQDRDFQNFCLAQVKGEKTYCYSIQDRDAQQQCLSQF